MAAHHWQVRKERTAFAVRLYLLEAAKISNMAAMTGSVDGKAHRTDPYGKSNAYSPSPKLPVPAVAAHLDLDVPEVFRRF